MSEALYRKYRPQKFKDVLGQDHVVSVLEGAINEDNVTHAYLFAGSRGTGKTSIARIFAHAIGTSDNDLHEIDAASNRGIDDVRLLREGVSVLPFESEKKVYIIDEVHMLTKEAFNALLKTLEEPPRHALFILATTEVDRLPDTIISRCETHHFKKPSVTVLRDMVAAVAKKEGLKLERASADLIALFAEGSFRDALGILQKVIASTSDNEISIEEVEKVVGAPKGELVNELLETIANNNLEEALQVVQNVVDSGVDMSLYVKLLLEKTRAVLLVHHSPKTESDLKEHFTEEDMSFIKELSGKDGPHRSLDTLKELLDAYAAMNRAAISQLPLELALVAILRHSSD